MTDQAAQTDPAPITAAEILADPRMKELHARLELERQGFEEHQEARRAALVATLREEDHIAKHGHAPTGGDNGKCAVCERVVHPLAE